MLRLEEIAPQHRDAYLAAAKEFYEQPHPDANLYYELAQRDFSQVIRLYRDRARGINLPPGVAKENKYVLVDNGTIIGRGAIRPDPTESELQTYGHIGYAIRPSYRGRGYGSAALRVLLEKSHALGITNPILVCKPHNQASIRIIEKNGGTKLDQVTLPDGTLHLRYMFHL